jgi:WbqC-like protein family.
MKRIAISQSNYIPWKGYFDMIRSVDEFVLYDDVQFTRRDWRNRNRIKTAHGLHWLTIPVKVKGRYHQSVRETEIEGSSWAESHWQTIRHGYARAACFEEMAPILEKVYADCSGLHMLSEVNRLWIESVCRLLAIQTPLRWSSEFSLKGDRSERLLNICLEAGADCYVSGPAARDYLDTGLFESAGVAVEWMSYEGYPEYPQLHGAFEHRVSVIDLLLNAGNPAVCLEKFPR